MNKKLTLTLGVLFICICVGIFIGFKPLENSNSQNGDLSRKRISPRIPATLTVGNIPDIIKGNRSFNGIIAKGNFARAVALDFNYKADINIGREYELSLEYRASPIARFRSDLGERVDSINGFVIYRLRQGPINIDQAKRYQINSFPVIKNANNQMIGLLTGRVIVKSKDPDFDAEAIVGGVSIYEAPHLGVSYLKLPEGSDLLEQYEEFQNNPSIERADLEILQAGVIPR